MRPTLASWAYIHRAALLAAVHFGLRLRGLRIAPEHPHPGRRDDGGCWPNTGRIVVRLHRVGRPRQPLQVSTVMATLAHELAHLRCSTHDAAHGSLTREIAAWFKAQGFPVAHKLHSNAGGRRDRVSFKRAWKRPQPRKGTACRTSHTPSA